MLFNQVFTMHMPNKKVSPFLFLKHYITKNNDIIFWVAIFGSSRTTYKKIDAKFWDLRTPVSEKCAFCTKYLFQNLASLPDCDLTSVNNKLNDVVGSNDQSLSIDIDPESRCRYRYRYRPRKHVSHGTSWLPLLLTSVALPWPWPF